MRDDICSCCGWQLNFVLLIDKWLLTSFKWQHIHIHIYIYIYVYKHTHIYIYNNQLQELHIDDENCFQGHDCNICQSRHWDTKREPKRSCRSAQRNLPLMPSRLERKCCAPGEWTPMFKHLPGSSNEVDRFHHISIQYIYIPYEIPQFFRMGYTQLYMDYKS